MDASNYTLSECSTILTFNSAYLDTLSVGEHTVELEYTTGSISYVLTISGDEAQATSDTNTTVAATDSTTDATTTSVDSVQTGDENNIPLLVAMLAVSICAIAGFKIYAKKFRA